MAIRFFCEKCQKPLEVDDADANKKVMCYYCQQAITVPATSAADLTQGLENKELNGQVMPLPKRSPVLGVLALICGLLIIAVIGGVFAWAMSTTILPMSRNPEFIKLSQSQQQAMVKDAMVTLSKHSIVHNSSIVLLGISALGTILSVVGLVKNSGRKAAIIGLLVCGAYLGLAVAGFITRSGS
jgi:hypothetical protein